MTSETGGGPPRGTSPLLDAAEGAVLAAGRVGYNLYAIGLSLLPSRTRQHVHTGVYEFHRAIINLPRGVANIVGDEVNRWAAGDTVAPAHVQHIKVGIDATAPAAKPAPAPASAAGVTISYIEFDPPGRDLAGEYVLISNKGVAPVSLTGWKLEDGGAKHTFVFPTCTLAPGAEVKLWTRAGANDAANLYWGNRTAIWNNEGDTATLKNAGGAVVGRYSYEGKK